MQPIVVTAMGIISSIGNSVEENLYSLRESKPQISRLDNLHSTLRDNIKVGEIKLSNSELAKQLGIDPRAEYSRTALLGIWAAKEAIAGLSADEVKSLGFVSASTVGGMDKTEQFFYEYKTNVEARRHIYTHNIGENTRMIADYFGIEGMVTAVSQCHYGGDKPLTYGAAQSGIGGRQRRSVQVYHQRLQLADDTIRRRL